MFENFIAVLTRIAVALEAIAGGEGVATDAKAPGKPRGRKAVGESNGVALTPEQMAAATQNAPSAASAAVATTTPAAAAATTAGDPPPVVISVTLQQVADAIIDLANNHSRDKAVAILTKYGVKKVPELKPETFNAVLADVAAAKAPATAASGLV